MGFFDFVSDSINNVAESVEESYVTAQQWSITRICDELGRISSATKIMGYKRALKEKTEYISDGELKELYRLYRSKNKATPSNCLKSIMEERGV